jgi:hypothetical protein
MKRAAHDGLIPIDVTVADFKIETAIGIGANPGFILDRCPLTTEIGQRHQVSRIAFLTLGESNLFHGVLLPTKNKITV